ncbi:hypothetical protein LCGC14_1208450 [marine sediment metagenome]|uniref:Uncharacterized protein n=1 Tax=marine sediment metagenome TaxID=412755 RepID=A0A0F9LJ59_9ZZZZ
MKINLDKKLVDLAGYSLQDRKVKRDGNGVVVMGEDGKPETELVDVMISTFTANALLHPVKGEEPVDKAGKYLLATKLYEAKEIDLTVEEIVLIKACVSADHVPTIVTGQIWKVLDPKGS